MFHLRSFTGFSIHLECWNAFRFGQSNKFWKKSLKKLDIQVWVLSRSSRGRPENVLGTSRINLPGTSLERQIKTSPGRHFRTSPGRQIRTSPGRQIGTSLGQSNRIFRWRPGDVGGGHPRDVLGTNICRLGIMLHYGNVALHMFHYLMFHYLTLQCLMLHYALFYYLRLHYFNVSVPYVSLFEFVQFLIVLFTVALFNVALC